MADSLVKLTVTDQTVDTYIKDLNKKTVSDELNEDFITSATALLASKQNIAEHLKDDLTRIDFQINLKQQEKIQLQGNWAKSKALDWYNWARRQESPNKQVAKLTQDLNQLDQIKKTQLALHTRLLGNFLFDTDVIRSERQLRMIIDDFHFLEQEEADSPVTDEATAPVDKEVVTTPEAKTQTTVAEELVTTPEAKTTITVDKKVVTTPEAKTQTTVAEELVTTPETKTTIPVDKDGTPIAVPLKAKATTPTIEESDAPTASTVTKDATLKTKVATPVDIFRKPEVATSESPPVIGGLFDETPSPVLKASTTQQSTKVAKTTSVKTPSPSEIAAPVPVLSVTKELKVKIKLTPEPQTVTAKLYTELHRLKARAINSKGFSHNCFWHAQYQAKVDRLEAAIKMLCNDNDQLLSDKTVIEAIKNPKSALSEALNQHTGYIFGGILPGVTLSSTSNGWGSGYTRAYLNMLDAVNTAQGKSKTLASVSL